LTLLLYLEAQPRNHWPPATCYTADGFGGARSASGLWLQAVGPRTTGPLGKSAEPVDSTAVAFRSSADLHRIV